MFVGLGLLLAVSQIVQVTALGWFLPSVAFLGAFGTVIGAVMGLVPGRTRVSASRPNTDDLEEIVAGLDTKSRVIWGIGLVVAGVWGWLFVLLLNWVAYP